MATATVATSSRSWHAIPFTLFGTLVIFMKKKMKKKKTPSQENELTYKTVKNKLTHIIRICKEKLLQRKN